MKKIRFTALLLCLVLMLSWTLSACEEASTPYDPASDNGEALEAAKTAALADLSTLLDTTEEIYAVTFWAWEYGSAFVEKPGESRYLKAMAALSTAERALDEIEIPRMSLSRRQFQLLDSLGIHLDNLTEACDTLDMTLENAQLLVQNLRVRLEQDIHMQVILEALPAYCDQIQQIMDLDCTYMGYLTNAVLLSLDREDAWKRLKEDHPCIARRFDGWHDNSDVILDLVDKNLALSEKVDHQTESFMGVMEYSLDVVLAADKTGDYNRLADLLDPAVSGIDYFPLPDFVGIDVSWMYTRSNDESTTVIAPLEVISDTPGACYASLKKVRRSDVESYAELVNQLGMRSAEKWDEESQTYTLTVASGSSYLLIQWTKKETVLYMSEPVGAFMLPLHYILLYMG